MSADDNPKMVALVGPHPPYRGGIAHFTERLSTHLGAAGLKVIPISFSRLYPDILFPGRSQFEEIDQSDASIRLIDSIRPWTWTRTAKRIEQSGASAAVFMYWMPFFAPAMRTIARYLRKRGIRTIAVVHNAVPHERHAGDRWLSRSFLRSCDASIVLSKTVERDVRELVPGQPVHFAPHPVYDQFGDLVDATVARRNLAIGQDRKVLLFFGMVRKYKGLNVLLEALPAVIDRLPEVLLIVAGEFYDDTETYREEIVRLGLTEHVEIHDEYIPKNRVAIYFSAADVVVQPYLSATQSGVVQIATNFERPCIVTDVGGLAETVGRAGSGMVVPPSDVRALSDAVIRYFSSDLKSDLEEGVRRTRRTSTWSRYVQIIRSEMGDG